MGGGPTFDKNADPSTYQKNSSMSTVFSLLNSMIGGTMLILPLYFNKTGLIMSTLVTIVMGIVSYKGCDIYIQHMKPNEFDIQDILKRIMGKRWSLFFVVISSIYLVLVVLLYYSFSIEMIYNIVTFIMYEGGSESYAAKSQISFSEYSIQYTALITLPIFCALLFLKDLKLMIRIAELGVYAIYAYVIFIFYCFISNITSGTLSDHIQNENLWSFDVGELASTASLAFQIHTNACPMIKCHKDQPKNRFVIKMTYVIGALIYLMIGIVGGLGVLGRESTTGKSALNINDYFATDAWQPLIVEMMYLVHLISMFPILADIGRNRVFEIIYKENNGKPPKLVFILFNITLICVCAIIKIIGVSPNVLVDLNGSFSCFFIVYLFPSLLHLACYHGTYKFLRSVRNVASIFIEIPDEDGNQNAVSLIEDESEQSNEEEDRKHRQNCNDHTKDLNSIPKALRVMTFVSIILLGVAIFIYGMYSVIANVINGDD